MWKMFGMGAASNTKHDASASASVALVTCKLLNDCVGYEYQVHYGEWGSDYSVKSEFDESKYDETHDQNEK